MGCAKVASANVEVVFSGAGRISQKSRCLDPQLLIDYSFLHYNYKYDWFRPTLEEIVAAYMKLYGVRCGGEADRFRCAPGLARVCAGGHAVRAAWTLRHGLLMRAGLTVLSANTCGAGHLLTRHLLKRHPIVRRVRLGGAESACSFPRLPTPA